jgi:hypothetical protein
MVITNNPRSLYYLTLFFLSYNEAGYKLFFKPENLSPNQPDLVFDFFECPIL